MNETVISTEMMIDVDTTTSEVIETTTVTSVDLSNLAEIDVDLLNNFLYIGTSFILGCLFWFVCKSLYRLLKMFF